MSSLSLHNNSSISKAAASSSISTSTKSLSFDDISKYFSLPLSDAANHLGKYVSLSLSLSLSLNLNYYF